MRKTWAEILKNKIDKHPFTLFLVVIVFFISSFFTIIQGASWTINVYNKHVNWREMEYVKINETRAGMNIIKFNEAFGIPKFVRKSNNALIEYIYKRRDYWIQAISTSSGEVLFYAVTSCDPTFKPTIEPNAIKRSITLQASTFHAVGDDPTDSKYYLRYATSNSYFYDYYYYGNPSLYQTIIVGINDACKIPEVEYPKNRNIKARIDINDEDIVRFRETAKINTYAETSPFASIDEVLEDFQIGVDRIQVRPFYSP